MELTATVKPTRRVLLGITGGIAAYKSAELTRLLVKSGREVTVAMTAAAREFVGPATFQALSGHPVFSDLWDARPDNGMAHIELTRANDVMLIAHYLRVAEMLPSLPNCQWDSVEAAMHYFRQ